MKRLVFLMAGFAIQGSAFSADLSVDRPHPEGGRVLLASDFSDGFQGWTSPNGSGRAIFRWMDDVPSHVTATVDRGAIWFTRVNNPGSYATGHAEYDTIKSPWFTLEGEGNMLIYETHEATEADWDKDHRRILLEYRDGRLVEILRSHHNDSEFDEGIVHPTMRTVFVSLDPFVERGARRARLHFVFDTVDARDNDHQGWVIDNVRVFRQDIPVLGWKDAPVSGSPAMGEHDGYLHIAAVSDDGELRVTRTDLGGRFENPDTLGALLTVDPAFYDPRIVDTDPLVHVHTVVDKDTYIHKLDIRQPSLVGGKDDKRIKRKETLFDRSIEPVMARVGSELYLFAVSKEGTLYRFRKRSGRPFGRGRALTLPNVTVVGRPSIGVQESGQNRVHVFFKEKLALDDSVRCRMLSYIDGRVENVILFPSFAGHEGMHPSVTVDPSKGMLFATIPGYNPRFHRIDVENAYSTSLLGSGVPMTTSAAMTFFNGRAFVHYAKHDGILIGYELHEGGDVELQFPLSEDPAVSGQISTDCEPVSFIYHENLLLAYRDKSDQVRYLRREKAHDLQGRHEYRGAKLLGERSRPSAGGSRLAVAQVGREVYCASRAYGVLEDGEAWGWDRSRTMFVCLTRSLFERRLRDLNVRLTFFNEANDNGEDFYAYPDLRLEPWRLGMISTLGRASWDMPEHIVRALMLDYPRSRGGDPQEIRITSWNGIASASYGYTNLPPNVDEYIIWAEWGHWLYWAAIDRQSPGFVPIFSEDAVDQALHLFGIDDFDTDTHDHAWLESMIQYHYRGDRLRNRAAQNEGIRDSYYWTGVHIWNGMSFFDGGRVRH